MKQYIKNSAAVLLFAVAATVTSCSIDDIKPYNKLTPENAVRDEASAQLILNGVYDLGREFDVSFFPLHLAALGNEGTISGFMSGSKGFNTNEVPVDNVFLTNLYSGHYKIINASNYLIEELEKGKAVGISDERKTEMIAEAKFSRAMANFNLLRYFGEFYDQNSIYGIVLSSTFSKDVVFAKRNTVAEVYTSIIADLEDASTNGPSYMEHYYAGKVAATALMARVKLYMNDFEGAAIAAQEVILNAEGFEL